MAPDVDRRSFLQGAALAGAAGAIASERADAAQRPASPPNPRTALSINGKPVVAEVEARVTLLDYLRERLQFTGTKKGCNEGACGACTVLVDGKRENACLVYVAQLDGAAVTTAEGIAGPDGELHPVQAAFIEHDAFQCGFCTPGQVVSAVACIAEGHATDETTVREWMSGNLCRCSAYPQITAAVLDAAARMKG